MLRGLREIPHVEIIRIGSRVPVFLPQRVDDELCEMLARYHPLWVNIHFNHPNEITPGGRARLRQAGRAPASRWATSRCCWRASTTASTSSASSSTGWSRTGSGRTTSTSATWWRAPGTSGRPVGKGLEIIEGLRGHTSGLRGARVRGGCARRRRQDPGDAQLPRFSYSDHKVVLRNYEGYITTYEEPDRVHAARPGACPYCRTGGRSRARGAQRAAPGRADVDRAERLRGDPRRADAEAHRLQDPSKWVPYGVGAIEGQPVEADGAAGAGAGEDGRPEKDGTKGALAGGV